jgi:hypothetical protein
MTERYLHDAFDITKYALSKLTDQDRDLLIQFDDFWVLITYMDNILRL